MSNAWSKKYLVAVVRHPYGSNDFVLAQGNREDETISASVLKLKTTCAIEWAKRWIMQSISSGYECEKLFDAACRDFGFSVEFISEGNSVRKIGTVRGDEGHEEKVTKFAGLSRQAEEDRRRARVQITVPSHRMGHPVTFIRDGAAGETGSDTARAVIRDAIGGQSSVVGMALLESEIGDPYEIVRLCGGKIDITEAR